MVMKESLQFVLCVYIYIYSKTIFELCQADAIFYIETIETKSSVTMISKYHVFLYDRC